MLKHTGGNSLYINQLMMESLSMTLVAIDYHDFWVPRLLPHVKQKLLNLSRHVCSQQFKLYCPYLAQFFVCLRVGYCFSLSNCCFHLTLLFMGILITSCVCLSDQNMICSHLITGFPYIGTESSKVSKRSRKKKATHNLSTHRCFKGVLRSIIIEQYINKVSVIIGVILLWHRIQ